jgi:lipoprotein-releasing system permease protein
MPPNLRIALRFLTARRRSMLMSLTGIVFGVGFFIVTQAQTGGFEQFFIHTILGTNGALRIEDRLRPTLFAADAAAGVTPGLAAQGGIEEPERVAGAVRQFRNVTGAAVVLQGGATITGATGSDPLARVFGINLDDQLSVSDLRGQVARGDLADFRRAPDGALLGGVLAGRLGLGVGDAFLLDAGGGPRRYHVSAIYETGVNDIDRVRVYLHLREARSLLRRPTGASFLQVGLLDPDRAPADAAQIQAVTGHAVTTWQQREKTWLEVFRALRVSSAITVSTIILVAGLGMFNTLAMLVLEKTREIAILRATGHTRRDIAEIFLWQGLVVLVCGTALGCLFGAGATWAVSRLPIRIRGIFSTDSFVVAWSPWHYVAAAATATVVVLVASWVPARRAARLEPGDVIRGNAQ